MFVGFWMSHPFTQLRWFSWTSICSGSSGKFHIRSIKIYGFLYGFVTVVPAHITRVICATQALEVQGLTKFCFHQNLAWDLYFGRNMGLIWTLRFRQLLIQCFLRSDGEKSAVESIEIGGFFLPWLKEASNVEIQ